MESGRPAGGSEEAVAYLAYELMLLGYDVTIYVDSLSEEERDYQYSMSSCSAHTVKNEVCKEGSVTWSLVTDYLPRLQLHPQYDIFIAWRYAYSLALCKQVESQATICLLWLHDLVPISSLVPLELAGYLVDAILLQSDFHRSFILQQYQLRSDRVHYFPLSSVVPIEESSLPQSERPSNNRLLALQVLPNGVPPSAFPSFSSTKDIPRNAHHIFIYGSAPNRGLQAILEHWMLIKTALPQAILRIYYGFTPSVIDRLQAQWGQVAFQQWYEHMIKMINTLPGIEYYGAVDHSTLVIAYAQAGFLLYPSDFPETACITLMRAMAAGIIPITSQYEDSVLSQWEDLQQFDLGPKGAYQLTKVINQDPILKSKWMQEYWIPAVIAAGQLSPLAIEEQRLKMIAMIQEQYTWSKSARILEEVFNDFSQLSK
jgi:glycosyltransferase involved in cell wall biosynthesis